MALKAADKRWKQADAESIERGKDRGGNTGDHYLATRLRPEACPGGTDNAANGRVLGFAFRHFTAST